MAYNLGWLANANATGSFWNGTTRTASTWSQVSTAVAASSSGDIVILENGSYTANSEISVPNTKGILIRARTVGSSTVTFSNGTGNAFNIATGNVNYTCLFGISFVSGATAGTHINVTGSGSKFFMMGKCSFDDPGTMSQLVDLDSLGGLMWGCSITGPTPGVEGGVDIASGCVRVKSTRAWATTSTMGTADTNGDVNFYVEDCTISNAGDFIDADDNARVVFRHNTINGTSGITHGATSLQGGRHLEYYNNTMTVDSSNRNIAARYVWMRAGTAVFTDNSWGSPPDGGSEWGNPIQLSYIVEIARSQWKHTPVTDDYTVYPSYGPGTLTTQTHQIGWGHNGSVSVSDPVYIWNESGARAYTTGPEDDTPNGDPSGTTAHFVVANRDIFVNNGAKSGYTKYTYPHDKKPTLADSV